MIKEWLHTLFTHAYPGAKELGLVAESAAIRARYQRNKKHWQPHLDKTKAIIRAAVDEAPKNRPIMILGAGECLDIPLSTLSRHKSGVYLVDIVLSRHILKRIKPYDTIHYMLHDITGYITEGADDDMNKAFLPRPPKKPGLVISCNVMSQLYLPFASSPPQDDDDRLIIDAMVRDHIDLLKRTGTKTLLISDYERLVYNGDKNADPVIEETIPRPIIDSELGAPTEKWQWAICPKGELKKGKTAVLNVGLWDLTTTTNA